MALIYVSAYHMKANPLSDLDMVHLQVSQRAEIMKIRSWAIKSHSGLWSHSHNKLQTFSTLL